jgi:hypothetical protein
VHEIATIWSQSTWRIKFGLALSLFLASGSIASLSDTVFRWKGFINDAVGFYHIHISGQLFRLLQIFASASKGIPDLIILSTLLIGANVRVAFFTLPTSRTREVARRAISTYIGSVIALLGGNYYMGREVDGGGALGIFIGSAFCASISYWRTKGAARILWFAWLLGPFIFVGLAAAFVSGLQRTN